MLRFIDMLEACKENRQPKVLKHLVPAQPFVFNLDDPEYFERLCNEINTGKVDDHNADIPFTVCAFENYSKPFVLVGGESGLTCNIHCLIAEELEPGNIIYYLYAEKDGRFFVQWHHKADSNFMWTLLNAMTKDLLKTLSKNQHGFSSPRTIFKWKDQGEKKQLRINKVIHVRKNDTSNVEYLNERNVQWSHAFWVMGHWRNVDGIGKDRDGNYVVKGKTWVTAFVKNAEAGDPVTKIRFNKEEK